LGVFVLTQEDALPGSKDEALARCHAYGLSIFTENTTHGKPYWAAHA